ncbi:MAG TPA: alpha/beta hydrolase [Patescibacteria group bacterium]|nr:alpha/beta hydrolase [Patescibacteria group bacterium]
MATSAHEGTIREPRAAPVSREWWRTAAWEHRWLGSAVAVAIAGALAVVSSIPMPRGPVTSGEGVLVILASLAVGVLAGYLVRSRWAMLVAPLAYLVAYELSRIGIAGASLDGFRIDTVYGVLAMVVGRGFHGLLALFPMAIGAAIGVALARPPKRAISLVPIGVLALAVIGLAVLVALPGSTPPVLGADGQPLPGSIAELSTVELGGQEQSILVRASDPDDPVLLYLSGGPGQSDLGYGRVLLEPLVADFVVVVWDQRGTGTSYGALDPAESLTLDQAVADTIQLSALLADRFDEERIYLLGESWGSTLGVLAVQQRPDLFHAYIGSGQMVSQRVTDQVIWRDLLAYAERAENWELYDQVLTFGEPPYRDTPWSNSIVMGSYPLLETAYTPPAAYIERGEGSGIGPYGILASEYGFVDKVNALRGLLDTFSLMYPQLQDLDFRTDVPALDVPVYVLDGEHELRGRRDLALEWFEGLSAPTKELITYADAGHSVVFEQADAFHRLMVDEIVPATYSVPR